MQMKMKVAALAVLLSATGLSWGQLIVPFEAGDQKVSYGSTYDKGYKGQHTDNGYFLFGMGFLVKGHSHRNTGVDFLVGGDFSVPFSNASYTGGIIAAGGYGQVNVRYRSASLSGGLDLHEYLFQDDANNANSRPNELLVSTPIMAKYNFGPGGRAYVQGGGSFVVANSASTVGTDSFGNTVVVSNATFGLSKTRQSGDIRFGAGYNIHSVTVRANYLHRDVFFNVTGDPTYASYYDFHEHTLSVGIVLSVF